MSWSLVLISLISTSHHAFIHFFLLWLFLLLSFFDCEDPLALEPPMNWMSSSIGKWPLDPAGVVSSACDIGAETRALTLFFWCSNAILACNCNLGVIMIPSLDKK